MHKNLHLAFIIILIPHIAYNSHIEDLPDERLLDIYQNCDMGSYANLSCTLMRFYKI